MRSRYDKRAIRLFILPIMGEKKREKTKGEGERLKEGPKDKTESDGRD
jgi:hypothetical protein